jgi:hypothetical protein
MKIHDVEQNSLTWLMLRAGIPTASEFDALFTPKLEPRKGLGVESYLARKLAERWLGGPLPGFNSIDMDAGKILEEEARPFVCLEFGREIKTVGFVTTDDGKLGCSPDGLIGEDSGCEIKCPMANTHVAYLLAGKVPDDYMAQVHGSMFVTGRPLWEFVSYRRHFPVLRLIVSEDKEVTGRFASVLGAFLERLDASFERLCELNGGPPRGAAHKPQPEPTLDPDEVGIIP